MDLRVMRDEKRALNCAGEKSNAGIELIVYLKMSTSKVRLERLNRTTVTGKAPISRSLRNKEGRLRAYAHELQSFQSTAGSSLV